MSLKHDLNSRMEAIRSINRSRDLTATERRVLVTLATRAPLDLAECRGMRTVDLAIDVFGEDVKSTRNQTLKALRGLEEMHLICRHFLGSKRDHNQWAEYFVLWPDVTHKCGRSSNSAMDESSNSSLVLIHQSVG